MPHNRIRIKNAEGRKDLVNTPSISYLEMADFGMWDLMQDLIGGTRAMRDAEKTWLPLQKAEKDTDYEIRRMRSFLFNGFSDTLRKLSAKPFSKPVIVEGELSDELSKIQKDVDGTNKSLNVFSTEVLKEAMQYGLHHVLVDFPRIPQGLTLKDEQNLGARPMFIHVKAPNLIGWNFGLDGKLDMVRILETVIVRAGRFKDVPKKQIRLYTRQIWQIYEPESGAENAEWKIVAEGEHTFGEVPLFTFYVDQTGRLTAKPPFLDLAWLNLAHWQSSSDQRNILRIVRVPMMFGVGFNQGEIDAGIVVGPNKIVTSKNPDAKIAYVEHSGAGIGAGRDDLEDLQNQMEILGLQPLIKKPGNETATGRAITEGKNQSELQEWIRGEEDFVKILYGAAAQWTGDDLPDEFAIKIFNDFAITLRGIQDATVLLEMRTRREISQETYLKEVKRRGIISEEIDVKNEIARIDEEGPALGMIGFEDTGAGDSNDGT